jgi:hypothetical protein
VGGEGRGVSEVMMTSLPPMRGKEFPTRRDIPGVVFS